MVSYLIRNRISLLVCDMAGTVINENGLVYKSLYDTLEMHGYTPHAKDIASWSGKEKKQVLYDEIYKKMLPVQGGEIDISWRVNAAESTLKNMLEDRYFNETNIELIDDNLYDFFACARINGIRIALNTGYSKEFQSQIIDHFKLDLYVDGFISSEEVKQGRPYPYMINNLMEEFDILHPKNIAKVGDTKNDMREGVNACCGIKIGVLSGFETKENLLEAGADVVVNKITDLNDVDDVPVFLL